MYIESVPNRSSPPAILLRESYRQDGRVKKRTLANLSKLPATAIETLRRVLRGEKARQSRRRLLLRPKSAPRTRRPPSSAPSGSSDCIPSSTARPAAAATSCSRSSSTGSSMPSPSSPPPAPSPPRAPSPRSARHSDSATSTRTNSTPPWTGSYPGKPPSSSASPSATCRSTPWCSTTSPPATSRGPTARSPGAATAATARRAPCRSSSACSARPRGCPVAVEVFEGSTADPKTVASQVTKIRERFGLQHVVLVGDRGMLTAARIREDLADVEGLRWITTLRAPTIRKLVDAGAVTPLVLRRAGPGRDHQRGFPWRAAHRVPQSPAGRRTTAQAPRAARGHREGPRAHRRRHPAREQAPTRQGGHRRPRREGHQPLQDGQALPDRHHRRELHVPPGRGEDRSRGAARRHLHRPLQRRARAVRCGADGPRLQGPLEGGAGLSQPQVGPT